MYEITKKALEALMEGREMRLGNTEVFNNAMYLHGNRIAWIKEGDLYISNCGWFSVTTKERLNALPNVSICQKRGVWYLNGKEWNGSPIKIGKFNSKS